MGPDYNYMSIYKNIHFIINHVPDSSLHSSIMKILANGMEEERTGTIRKNTRQYRQ